MPNEGHCPAPRSTWAEDVLPHSSVILKDTTRPHHSTAALIEGDRQADPGPRRQRVDDPRVSLGARSVSLASGTLPPGVPEVGTVQTAGGILIYSIGSRISARWQDNAVVLVKFTNKASLNKEGLSPVGTRIKGPISSLLRHKAGCQKVISLCKTFI